MTIHSVEIGEAIAADETSEVFGDALLKHRGIGFGPSGPESVVLPLVLLDFDGVINAWPRDGTEAHHWDCEFYRCHVASETLQALRRVLMFSDEIVWCTAHRETANGATLRWLQEQGIVLGGKLYVITDGVRPRQPGFWSAEWKLEAVREDAKVQKALYLGQEVWWIEDFDHRWQDDITSMGIKTIDTAVEGKLLLKHLKGTPF